MDSNSPLSQPPPNSQSPAVPKSPRFVLGDRAAPHRPTIFSFSPNRETLGGTAYLIVDEVNILVDCPAWNEATQAFLQAQGGVSQLFLTHRGAMAQVRDIQQALLCAVIVQEQEAYLLPQVNTTSFEREFNLTPNLRAIWTPGHSPGSACLYYNHFGGVLFSGRHLLPHPEGNLVPIKTPTTFHWRRQLQSLHSLSNQFTSDTLHWICPGANLGFLRGKSVVDNAYHSLRQASQALPPPTPVVSE